MVTPCHVCLKTCLKDLERVFHRFIAFLDLKRFRNGEKLSQGLLNTFTKRKKRFYVRKTMVDF